MVQKNRHTHFRSLLILGIIWLASALCDRVWFALDHSVPAWDEADYLTGSLNYWQALQHPEWFSGEWWTNFWQLSSKIPPFTYIATAIIQNIFGTGADQATLVQLLFSAVLLGSVYGLGVQLFNRRVGLWAAGLTVLFPALYRYRLEFLLDYPLTAVVTFSFFCLTVWRNQNLKAKGSNRISEKSLLPQPIAEDPPKSPLKRGARGDRGISGTFEASSKQQLNPHSLFWAVAFGVSLGIALMVKQTALFFLVTPILWVLGGTIRQRNWGRLAQFVGSLGLSVLVFGFWYRTNWLLMLTSGKRATIDSAIAEGDPPLNTIEAWVYYWKILPYLVSWLLLLVSIVGLILYWKRQGRQETRKAGDKGTRETRGQGDKGTRRQGDKETRGQGDKGIFEYYSSPPLPRSPAPQRSTERSRRSLPSSPASLTWLTVFFLGGYLLCSLNINKDDRYILPLLPVLSLVLAYGLTLWKGRWGKNIRWGTVTLASLLMILNLFPLGGRVFSPILSPFQYQPYLGEPFPHSQVIDEIIETSPYLRTTLGVLPSTPEINQHNFNYYGALQDFQVYGRQVGTRQEQIQQDVRSLSWFLTKTGEQGSVPEEQGAMVQAVEQGGDFGLQKSWSLPDGSILKLYHRRELPVEVEGELGDKGTRGQGDKGTRGQKIGDRIQLDKVTVPEKVPPGVPVPISYEWVGAWKSLQSGIVLLTWKGMPQHRWLHDHGIGMGELHFNSKWVTSSEANTIQTSQFRVVERMAMLPPGDIPAGSYSLEATYLNRETGETYPIQVPPVTVTIDPAATATPAPELDLVTQLRTLAVNLQKGTDALEPIFEQTGRINQYDPIQDYLVQADLALAHRLTLEPQNLDWAYGLALSRVLQEDAEGAIAALKRVVELDSKNPYARAYLAFVYLYQWRGKQAEYALKPALEVNPNLPELQALSGVAALLQGNVFRAWQMLEKFR